MDKETLRSQLIEQRLALSPQEWGRSSRRAQQRLLRLAEYLDAGSVALYAPMRNEVDTAMIALDARSRGKKVLYPQVCETELAFCEVPGPEALVAGAYGILEPCSLAPADRSHGDIIVVPGVAFDRKGHRLGYGKGFYDRYLAGTTGHRVTIVGLCHGFQVTESLLPAEPHDIPMMIVITDETTQYL